MLDIKNRGWRNAQLARVHQIEETNVQAVRSYVPKPNPGRILLFMSEERYSKSKYDPASQCGWGAVAEGGVGDLCGSFHIPELSEKP